ncbi:Sorting nexin-4 [Salinomyces thailandicus]|uniref:Sorting nexin-4 n=1 Tax=Salinomyces thailandicus TaxID=706561 RepID=A0A4U0TZX0_9PEZI|nr:Sorting nexin-4 [Salinomyces thailandica]
MINSSNQQPAAGPCRDPRPPQHDAEALLYSNIWWSNDRQQLHSPTHTYHSTGNPDSTSRHPETAQARPEDSRDWLEGDDFHFVGSSEDGLPQADGHLEGDARVASGGGRATRCMSNSSVTKEADNTTQIAGAMDAANGNEYEDPSWEQAGAHADPSDLAGPGAHGRLQCRVEKPQKEGEGTQNAYVSYLVVADTDFKSFQSSHVEARRRFTDFLFLYKTLAKEYPQCAVPPLPDKHSMAYVRGDRFGPEFTNRRAFSLQRFLKRLTLHPVLRRATILALFLESSDWNATMKSRPMRGMSGSDSGGNSVLESWTDGFLNAFSKPHKTDKRFQDVNDRAKKLDDDLGTVSKTVARVAKREGDLETDYADLAMQFQKLSALEPGVHDELTNFATSVQSTSEGWKGLKDHTDQDYLGSLKDMESYISSIKGLLKTREQKQLDFEALTDYLTKAAQERDTVASHGSVGASGFLRQKIEDVRGVDHEQSRRERQRKLEVQISRLTTEVEAAKKTSEAFDEEVVKEVGDFERIKAVEFRDTLGGLADANIAFFQGNIEIWERFVRDMEKQQAETGARRSES